MRRIWLAVLLVLLPGLAVGQDFIKYTPPAGVATSTSAPGFSYAINVGSLVNGGTAGTPVPQTFSVYNFCDGAACATGYERLSLAGSATDFSIIAQAAGTGTLRDLYLKTGANRSIYIAPGNATRWQFIYDGALLPYDDDSFRIGQGTFRVANFYLSRAIQGSRSKTLVDAAAAVSFVRVAVATNASAGGTVIWNAMSTNGTSPLTQVGSTYFAGVNTAGTVTCTVGAVGTPITAYSRVNTIACTVSAVTSTTNCDLQVTCTDNLAGDQTPVFNWRLDMPVPNTVTPQ